MSKYVKVFMSIAVVLSFCMLCIGFATLQEDLTVEGDLNFTPKKAVLLPGWLFDAELQKHAPDVTTVIFDKMDGFDFSSPEYKDVTLNGVTGIPVDMGDGSDPLKNQSGLIRLYVVGDTAYVLSDRQIYAPWDCSGMFAGRSNLTSIQFNCFDTSDTVHMGSMFAQCTGLQKLDLRCFDTQNVVNMHEMFMSCQNLTELNVSSFDTSKVTRTQDGETIYWGMKGMFQDCHSIKKLDLSNFDTSNIKGMFAMFYNCYELTELNISSFNTTNVESMSEMFQGCRKLTNLDLSHFNTSKVTDMHAMFSGCQALQTLTFSNSFQTGGVTNMSQMFYLCQALTSLDVSMFDTSNVTDMSHMFRYCETLCNLNLSNFNTQKVTTMQEMFEGCLVMEELDISNFDTRNVTNMYQMFNRFAYSVEKFGATSSYSTIYGGNWNTEKVTNATNMFEGCWYVKGGNGTTRGDLEWVLINENNMSAAIAQEEARSKKYARVDGGLRSNPGYFTAKTA